MNLNNFIVKYGADYSQKLSEIINVLEQSEGLISCNEILQLKQRLAILKKNKAFVVQIGECAETFSQATVEDVNSRVALLNDFCEKLQQGSFLVASNIVKIGRIAGQYAKPRSESFEVINGKKLPVYQGDIVNDFEFNEQNRTHDAERLLTAYQKAKTTINLMQKYGSDIYTSHEALILPYELALTKESCDNNDADNIAGLKHYNSSAHMLWLGERTRFLKSAHVEYLSKIINPIGIKISDKTDITELLAIIKKINPSNESGKIILISRMGNNIVKVLANIINHIQKQKLEVLWFCDCMHGNTVKIDINHKTYKVRYMEDIFTEIDNFAKIMVHNNEYWAGIHLESTYLNVDECISKADNIEALQENMESKYLTFCDPRLNYEQTMAISDHVAMLLNKCN